ncbi:MAG: glutamate-cysteine ligase family protein [Rubripirellula sp.]
MKNYKLFEVSGIELEYMLVDAGTLAVRPIADQFLTLFGGAPDDVTRGSVTWCNELASHVIEVKTTQPQSSMVETETIFRKAIADAQPTLDALNLKLLPTAMHPWMDPEREAMLWPHENAEIYSTYDRIFNCRSHGWCNVQSVHLNLPFENDADFKRLHAAIRILLPLLPALAASSPITGLKHHGILDSRLEHYAQHCSAIPSLIGRVIPERVFNESDYRDRILEPIKRDIAPHDTDGVMATDFLNARGAIARFDRGSIEIRLLDIQEHPTADVAICALIEHTLKALVHEETAPVAKQIAFSTDELRLILDANTIEAEHTYLTNQAYLALFGLSKSIRAGEFWEHMIQNFESSGKMADCFKKPLQLITNQGTLATRILKRAQCMQGKSEFLEEEIRRLYREFADCLENGTSFQP